MLSIEETTKRIKKLGFDTDLVPLGELSVFRILLHNEPVADGIAKLLLTLLFTGNSLDARLRELIIMRLGWVCGSVYEWTAHWQLARDMEISEEDLLAVKDWKNATSLSEADRAVLQATDDCLEKGFIQEATWQECFKHLKTEAERVELVIAIANWSMFAQLLQSLSVPLEEGSEPWPPNGQAPG
ncbi:MAG: carboxymuconolactone decarboxylase family protein [Gammaproteobacteria bacterium]|nr:MAG: carboxymuconolactone decarboxylase family protein [Gammaproteobacteria bacterium]RLA55619.1 MAG: carboxymuconolactone decarboxylase family protein [Gammaproteobacteria bacterium]HDY82186.1 carboxymuconolactone decarboxylase family protein [Halieaceae bacterium]